MKKLITSGTKLRNIHTKEVRTVGKIDVLPKEALGELTGLGTLVYQFDDGQQWNENILWQHWETIGASLHISEIVGRLDVAKAHAATPFDAELIAEGQRALESCGEQIRELRDHLRHALNQLCAVARARECDALETELAHAQRRLRELHAAKCRDDRHLGYFNAKAEMLGRWIAERSQYDPRETTAYREAQQALDPEKNASYIYR